MSLYGLNLSCGTTPQILVDGTAVQVLSSSATQVNFVMPPLGGKANAAVQFVCGAIASASSILVVAPVAPGIFLSGATPAAAFNQDFTYNGATSPALAAPRGTVIMLFGTGFGELNAPDANGLQWTVQPVTVTVGGVPAQVLFAGAAPGWPGLNQFNVVMPGGAPTGASVPVVITVGNLPQNATVSIN